MRGNAVKKYPFTPGFIVSTMAASSLLPNQLPKPADSPSTPNSRSFLVQNFLNNAIFSYTFRLSYALRS
jgi:hypothetical protein